MEVKGIRVNQVLRADAIDIQKPWTTKAGLRRSTDNELKGRWAAVARWHKAEGLADKASTGNKREKKLLTPAQWQQFKRDNVGSAHMWRSYNSMLRHHAEATGERFEQTVWRTPWNGATALVVTNPHVAFPDRVLVAALDRMHFYMPERATALLVLYDGMMRLEDLQELTMDMAVNMEENKSNGRWLIGPWMQQKNLKQRWASLSAQTYEKLALRLEETGARGWPAKKQRATPLFAAFGLSEKHTPAGDKTHHAFSKMLSRDLKRFWDKHDEDPT